MGVCFMKFTRFLEFRISCICCFVLTYLLKHKKYILIFNVEKYNSTLIYGG